jgi:hypothetical protein
MHPGVKILLKHLPGVRWEAGDVVAEVEPSLLPLHVVGCHGTR